MPDTSGVKMSATWPISCGSGCLAVAGGDPGALLASMLQRVQPQVGQIGRFRVPVNGEYAALVVELVEHRLMTQLFRQRLLVARCNEAISLTSNSALVSDFDPRRLL